MKVIKLSLFQTLALLFLVSFQVHSQSPTTVNEHLMSNEKIENKFNSLLEKASVFKEYKVIHSSAIEEFRVSFSNHLMNSLNNFSDLHSELENKDALISSLQTQVATVKMENSDLNESVNTISIFGFSLEKRMYSFLMWSLVVLFGIIAFFFAYRFKVANEVTRNSKHVLAEVENEYQLFKQNAIEREQKLRRQLQDEIIKCRELKEVS